MGQKKKVFPRQLEYCFREGSFALGVVGKYLLEVLRETYARSGDGGVRYP